MIYMYAIHIAIHILCMPHAVLAIAAFIITYVAIMLYISKCDIVFIACISHSL